AEPLHQARLAAAGDLHTVDPQQGDHREGRQAKQRFQRLLGALATS
ncbi:MAG: hypothetical protein RLZZ11_1494, partial [Cyanobacteriota bacterium]